jgi:hypothetical protein
MCLIVMRKYWGGTGMLSRFRSVEPFTCNPPDLAAIAQALAERAQTVREQVRRFGAEEPDQRERRLLRARRERTGDRRAAEKGDELPSSHGLPQSTPQDEPYHII